MSLIHSSVLSTVALAEIEAGGADLGLTSPIQSPPGPPLRSMCRGKIWFRCEGCHSAEETPGPKSAPRLFSCPAPGSRRRSPPLPFRGGCRFCVLPGRNAAWRGAPPRSIYPPSPCPAPGCPASGSSPFPCPASGSGASQISHSSYPHSSSKFQSAFAKASPFAKAMGDKSADKHSISK